MSDQQKLLVVRLKCHAVAAFIHFDPALKQTKMGDATLNSQLIKTEICMFRDEENIILSP